MNKIKQIVAMEFFGTFFLMLLILASGGLGPMQPFAVGAVLIALIYAGINISGAHYNPAVSITLCALRKISLLECIAYIAAQIIAVLIAMYTANTCGIATTTAVNSSASGSVIFILETIFTTLLLLTVLLVAVHTSTKNNSYYGIAIALAVMASAWCIGGSSGSMINPAVSIGCALQKIIPYSNVGIYIGAQLAGVLLSVVFYKLVASNDAT